MVAVQAESHALGNTKAHCRTYRSLSLLFSLNSFLLFVLSSSPRFDKIVSLVSLVSRPSFSLAAVAAYPEVALPSGDFYRERPGQTLSSCVYFGAITLEGTHCLMPYDALPSSLEKPYLTGIAIIQCQYCYRPCYHPPCCLRRRRRRKRFRLILDRCHRQKRL